MNTPATTQTTHYDKDILNILIGYETESRNLEMHFFKVTKEEWHESEVFDATNGSRINLYKKLPSF